MDAISTHYHLVSEVNVSPVTCNWVIDNFSTFYSNFPRSKTKDNKIVSAPFRFGNDTATKGFFSLVHYMDGICESVIVSLQVHSGFENPVKFGFRLETLEGKISPKNFSLQLLSLLRLSPTTFRKEHFNPSEIAFMPKI